MLSAELHFCCFFLANRVKCSAILYSLPKQLNLIPRSFRLTDQFSGNYAVEVTSFFKNRKPLPNLVNSSWLWWVIREILANQKRRNNYLERIIKNSSAWVAFKWVVPPRSQNVDPIFKELCIQKDAPGSKISHFYQAKKYSVHVIST